MTKKQFITDESAITVAVETIIFFSISIIFMGMIFLSFQGFNQSQSTLLMEEQLTNIGNGIARTMSDMNVEVRINNNLGSNTSIRSDFWIPEKIVDDTYSIKLKSNKILLESTTGTFVSVEVPVDSSLILTENSTIYSTDGSHGLEYDSASGALFFTDGGVKPLPDVIAPNISIVSPADNSNIDNTTYINVAVSDDRGVTRVDYYVNGTYKYSASSPFNWSWNTRTMDDGGYIVTARAIDAAGNNASASRNYTISNPDTLPPEITGLSPSNGSLTYNHKPTIIAQISDDKGINFSSILLLVDNYDQTSNITYTLNSSTSTILNYNPVNDLSDSWHNVNLTVKDSDSTVHTVMINWSFNVTVAPPNQSSELEINASAPQINKQGSNYYLNIRLKDNNDDIIPVLIKGVNISWNNSGQIESVKFDTSFYWKSTGSYTPSGAQNSGTPLTWGSPYPVELSFKIMEIKFSSDPVGKNFTIVFTLNDLTTKTASFTASY